MEPFLAIGEILTKNGHQVVCLFPEQFRKLAEDSGFEFTSLGAEFIQLLESPEGQIAMGGGSFGWKKVKAYASLISRQPKINGEMFRKQFECVAKENPDRIVHNGKAVYPVVWSLDNPGKTILVSPVPYLHFVKDQAHVAFHRNFGPLLNKLTYKIANYGLVKTIMGSLKWLPASKDIKQRQIQRAMFSNKAIYTVSPSLFERPDYWADNIQVLGYHERNKTQHWQPSSALEQFFQKHSKVLLITFGSMVNSAPAEKTRIILEILERNNLPAIINTASGGLVKPANYNAELFHFVESIPYDWAFPKVYGVVHHGGSGTTHTALKYGCASLIIPHIIDQYVWNKIAFKKGVGPLGMDVSKVTVKSLEPKILELVNHRAFKERAEELAKSMANEHFETEVCKAIVDL